jgi:UDPglucose 6-dehydrogenase
MLNPDFVLIGESDSHSGDLLSSLYQTLCDNSPPIARMSLVNAELTKLAVNTFVTTKISYANMLAQICERLPGADVDVVTSALGLDSRVGRKYLKGAVGYGGPCFPRDNLAFAYLARQIGTQAILAEATQQVNSQQIDRLVQLVLSRRPKDGRVGILGLAYKPDTNIIEESQGIALARQLVEHNIDIVLYDPMAMENARLSLRNGPIFTTSAAACIRQVDVAVLTTPWAEFRSLTPDDLNTDCLRPVLIDCWRVLNSEQFARVADYITLGLGPLLQATDSS